MLAVTEANVCDAVVVGNDDEVTIIGARLVKRVEEIWRDRMIVAAMLARRDPTVPLH